MAAYRRVYDSRHLQADCQEPGSAPEPYVRQSSMGYLYLIKIRILLLNIAYLLTHGCLCPAPSPHGSRHVEPVVRVCKAPAANSLHRTISRNIPSTKRLPLLLADLGSQLTFHMDTLESTLGVIGVESTSANGSSSGSFVFTRLTLVTNRQTDRQTETHRR